MKKNKNSNNLIDPISQMKDAAIDPGNSYHSRLSEYAGIEIGSSGHDSIREATRTVECSERIADQILALLKKGSWNDFIDFPLISGLTVLAVIAKTDKKATKSARTLFSQSGGKASKQDNLQKLIVTIVKKKPAIKSSTLLGELESYKNMGTIVDIDEEEISFISDNEKLDSSPISGLKDRLSRAKKDLGLSKRKKS